MQAEQSPDEVGNDQTGTHGHTPYVGELPERLRRRATGSEYDPVLRAIAPDLLEAAAEIERLRKDVGADQAVLDAAERLYETATWADEYLLVYGAFCDAVRARRKAAS